MANYQEKSLITTSKDVEHPKHSDGVLRRQLKEMLKVCKDHKKALAYAKVFELITEAISNLRSPHH